jgi:hypothetical protein
VAKHLAVRDIQTIDGRIYVGYTYGDPPIVSYKTAEIDFMDEADLKTQVGRIEEILGITYLKQDGTLGNPNQVTNKTLILDPYAANPLRIV